MKHSGAFKDFKKFVNRGNIIDLATGIIIGASFTAVVNSLVNDILMPLISRIINYDLTGAKVELRPEIVEIVDGEEVITQTAIYLRYGQFIQNLLNFLLIAIVIFLLVRLIRGLKQGYIKSEIKYIKKLKARHPEFFDEEDEFGTLLYEKLKKEHPEEFKNEINAEIEKAKAQEKQNLSPQEITNELLLRLNENLEKMNENKQINNDNKEEEKVDSKETKSE